MARRCAHTYEENITCVGDSQESFYCIHCGNVRYEERDHACTYVCWLEHHPQEFVEDCD